MNIIDISQEKLDKIIKEDENIIEYNDLHIHKPSSKYNFISFHIVLKNDIIALSEIENITDNIKENLKKNGFNHILIQVDSDKKIKNTISCNI
jgi:cobalt-zinc-cadmium efflux system protein